ncbi:MAG TPA: phosphate ABC transporter substrate-binding protein PstS [Rhodanobacteraceae bacterium]
MHPVRSKCVPLAFAAALVFCGGAANATGITGAGSSFIYPVLSKWAAAYAQQTGNEVNYQSIGSGGGIAQIKAGTVDFGASDMPLDAETLDKFGLAQFPDVIGGVVAVYNIPGVASGKLILDGPVLAKIFLGDITQWSAPAISALNPGLKLPAVKITVVHRSDGSGTTFNFANYLSKADGAWKAKVGAGTAVSWPTGIGGKGNEGVSAYVRRIPGAIGYVEYAYALQNHVDYALLRNAAGRVVRPDTASFEAAAATADWSHVQDFDLLLTNAPGAAAWPIAATSWVIVHRHPRDAAKRKVVLDFFRWAYTHGRRAARALDYVPLPPTLVRQIAAYWHAKLEP